MKYLPIYIFQQGNSKADNAKAAAAGLKLSCTVCKSSMPDPKTYKQVFFNFAEVELIFGRVGSVKKSCLVLVPATMVVKLY